MLAPELLQDPAPQTPHEEAALAPVVDTKVPAEQEVQPPVSVDVPEETLNLPLTHAVKWRNKTTNDVSKREFLVITGNRKEKTLALTNTRRSRSFNRASCAYDASSTTN